MTTEPEATDTLANTGSLSHSGMHRFHANVKAYGAVGNGVVDDTSAIQAAIDDAAANGGGLIYIPPGDYMISSPLTVNDDGVRISGATATKADSYPFNIRSGSRIIGGIAGNLIERTNSAASVAIVIENLALWNTQAGGTCISLAGVEPPGGISHCALNGDNGVVFGTNTFGVGIENSWVHGYSAGATGITMVNHTHVRDCDVVGFTTGISTPVATGCTIIGGRFEVNVTGISVGLMSGLIGGMTFEANDTAITINGGYGLVISGVQILGSVNAPSGSSDYGIDIDQATGVLISGVTCTGAFANYAFRVQNTAVRHDLTLMSCYTSASGGTWSIGSDHSQLWVINCDPSVDNITRAPIIATGSLPAAATAENGRLVIEDNGAGDRNLIIYAGGQRFRIDGGAAV